jgi:hypothetical protein
MPALRNNSSFGSGVSSTINATSNIISSAQTSFASVRNLSNALTADGSDVASVLRSSALPTAGEAIGDLGSAFASFLGGDADPNDWRVRLSLPTWPSFRGSPVLAPLKDAGGLIFPYTPTITMKSGATYQPHQPVHTNYPFRAYKSSSPGTVEIVAPMNVEDQTQALYWIAAVHYLRSLSKMFTGADPKAGNPPPIVRLNGYGQYVFKNVPVVLTSFNCTLPNDCDYIGVNVQGSLAGAIADVADSLSGLLGGIGGVPSLKDYAGLANSASNILGAVSSVASVAGSLGITGSTPAGFAYVPTKSQFTISLEATYSRQSARSFSLDRFVTGGYVSGSTGYI